MAPKTRRKTDTTETATAVATPPPMEARIIAISEIDRGLGNPRKHFEAVALAELAANIQRHGVLQPILVRPQAIGYQIVAGERRWRAAKIAGLTEIPAVVREMTDREALELALVENITRADLSPIEEGDAFHELVEVGATVEEIAAKVARSQSYVRARLRLHSLPHVARELMAAGRLDVSRALIVAALSVTEHQEQAARVLAGAPSKDDLASLNQRHCDRATQSLAEARAFVRNQYTLLLAAAPFDVKDARLTLDAGSCLKCPKMSRNQADLFGEPSDKDRCTDAACWGQKSDNAWARAVSAARKAGHAVVEDDEADALSHTHINLDDEPWQDRVEGRTWAALLGNECPPVTLARDMSGAAERLVEKAAAMKALAARGVEWAVEEAAFDAADDAIDGDDEPEMDYNAARVKRDRDRREARAVGAVLATHAAQADELPTLVERHIASAYITGSMHLDLVLEGRFDADEAPNDDAAVDEWLRALPMQDVRGLVTELMAVELGIEGPEREYMDLMRVFGQGASDAVDAALLEVEREIAAEDEPEQPTKGKRTAKAKRVADEEE